MTTEIFKEKWTILRNTLSTYYKTVYPKSWLSGMGSGYDKDGGSSRLQGSVACFGNGVLLVRPYSYTLLTGFEKKFHLRRLMIFIHLKQCWYILDNSNVTLKKSKSAVRTLSLKIIWQRKAWKETMLRCSGQGSFRT